MSDIVGQIRQCAADLGRDDEETKIFFWHCGILREAANEIVSLRQQVEEAREALKRLASPEAFTIPRSTTEEERARMFYAEAILAGEADPEGYAVRRALAAGREG